MNLDRRLVSQLVAATMNKIVGSGLIPQIQTGQVTEEGSQPLVTPDATDPNAPAPDPVPCRVGGDPPGLGERVLVISAAGTGWVIGRLGGSVRNLGQVTATADDPFTSAETLDTLSLEVTVNQPGRILKVSAQGLFTVDTNGASVLFRVAQDGVAFQRVGQHVFPASTSGEIMGGFGLVIDPDPGSFTFTATGECVGGTGQFEGATSAGWLLVEDMGNLTGNP